MSEEKKPDTLCQQDVQPPAKPEKPQQVPQPRDMKTGKYHSRKI